MLEASFHLTPCLHCLIVGPPVSSWMKLARTDTLYYLICHFFCSRAKLARVDKRLRAQTCRRLSKPSAAVAAAGMGTSAQTTTLGGYQELLVWGSGYYNLLIERYLRTRNCLSGSIWVPVLAYVGVPLGIRGVSGFL